jgi:K+-sensing histidine kinase KdpD
MIFVMKILDGLSDSRGMLHWFVGTLIVAVATMLLVWLGADSTAAGMVFLVLVVWSSTQAGQWLALYIAALCALSFDYFFLLPYHTFRLAGAQEWVAMISFLLSCLVVGRVAERARAQARQAVERREDVERLYELSQEMMLQGDASGLIRDLPRMIERIFALDGVVLYVRDQDQFYTSTEELPMSILASLRAMTLGENPRRSCWGCSRWGRWDCARPGFRPRWPRQSAPRWPSRSLAPRPSRLLPTWKPRAKGSGCAAR